ncbi:PAS domain S-box-containing protein/diguanylate cyclase (GGDEF)-like protein [Blastococcus colisei]|uniref:PAS domain S-box-containing protein/diguanylate cyclase (GGDEF)-like protein n=1 Tax=Blastococcus colisei TaxID=1564162 RepID=A0A543P1N6_9ACTN|nr:diguanylate cyclase [Blastococcus colisei]TQN37978.1 PAS domain S-box-containing protein/diguanylate cyclase (GGDEF)-like protein [Blastococcus colisei]
MIALRSVPWGVRTAVPLALVGLALAVPFSAPDGTGMQWDELVLGSLASMVAWSMFRRLRTMDRDVARPWYPTAFGAVFFALAQLLAGSFPGPGLDGFGFDDVILFFGATSPVVTAGMLARRVSRTRWSVLVVEGALITTAMLVVTEVLHAALIDPVEAPDALRTLVFAYGAYGALMLGGIGALCTVSTAALRSASTVLIVAVTCQSAAAGAEAIAIVSPATMWTAVSDASVAAAMLASTLAVHLAPLRLPERGPRASAPVVSPVGLAMITNSMLTLPAALIGGLLWDVPFSAGAQLGCALVFGLTALRSFMRVRDDGRVIEDLVRSEEDFRELIEASSDGIAIMDGEFRLLFTSPAARSLLGIDSSAQDAVSLLDLVDPADRDTVRAATLDVPAGEGAPLHFRVVPADGSHSELEATSTERPGSGRRVLYLRDVTTRRRRERELERMAYTDHLTGLPNRATLFRELATPSVDDRCLLVLDLDGFKAVNDVAGHEAGDHLLVEVARRLHTVVREDDLVARLGGDEFAVLVTGTLAEAQDVAQRVVDVLGMPYRTADGAFAVGASVGVAALGAAGGQVAFREADAALRAAKQAGKGCVRTADAPAPSHVEAHPDFADVVAEGLFSVRMDAACHPDGRIALVHATPSWSHPDHPAVQNLELWGFAGRQGRATELRTWLLHQACREVAALPDERVDVAVSLPAGFVPAEGLAAEIAAALDASGLAASRLMLSFTEETLLTGSAALVPELEAVRRSGVRLCLDNYGMGHSLFALLARVHLDAVRLDLNGLSSRDDTTRALQVLAAIVRTNTGFGLTTIAGGVSTPEVREAVVATGVQLLHGRSEPHDLTAAEVAALLTVPAV